MISFSEIPGIIPEEDLPAALCIVVSAKGSAPRKEGAKMLVMKNGKIKGTIGGGNLEKQVIKDALKVMEGREGTLFRHDLLHHHEMCCGGSVQIYIEPIMKKNKLYIFGAGHTGKALANLASGFDFETVVVDDRKEYIKEIAFPGINKMNLPFTEALNLLPFDENTYVAIITYSHPADREILFQCMKKPHAYLGMIGSRRKVEFTKKLILESGFSNQESLYGIDMPMGIDIGAEGPEEIALSIMAKIIQAKNSVKKRMPESLGNSGIVMETRI